MARKSRSMKYSLANHVSQRVIFLVDGEYGSVWNFHVQFFDNSGAAGKE